MEFLGRMPQPVRLPADTRGPYQPNNSPTGEKPLSIPEKPLAIEEIETLDKNECFAVIKERYQIEKGTLFTDRTETATTWDEENLSKLALMRLEGIEIPVIASFFSQEFSLLQRRDVAVSETTIRVTVHKFFSQTLRERIRLNRSQSGWLIPRNTENDNLIANIEKMTGLSRSKLFSKQMSEKTRWARHGVKVTTANVLQAFLMRLHGRTYEEIFVALQLPYSVKNLSNITSQMSQLFSREARALLPQSKSPKDSAGTGNRTPI